MMLKGGIFEIMNVFITSLLKIINNPDIAKMDYTIAYYLLVNYDNIPNMSIQELAGATYVSVPTLNRFFQSYGFNKFSYIKEMMQAHKNIRLMQLKKRYEDKKWNQVDNLLKDILEKEDYENQTNNELIIQCCEKIKACQRIVFMGSDEMMALLIRVQGDLTVMGKLTIQNSIYQKNFKKMNEDDLVVLFSMTGKIWDLLPKDLSIQLATCPNIIIVGHRNYLDKGLFLKIPDYVDETIENLLLDNYFQNISYTYYEKYYDHQ